MAISLKYGWVTLKSQRNDKIAPGMAMTEFQSMSDLYSYFVKYIP